MLRYLRLIEIKLDKLIQNDIKKKLTFLFEEEKPILMHRWKLYQEDKNDDSKTSDLKKKKFEFYKVDSANEDHCGICSNYQDSIFKKKL